jgi:integrase/recombinase XerD
LLDTGLRVGGSCGLVAKDLLRQRHQLRIKGEGGLHVKKTELRLVPMSNRVRAILEHHFAQQKAFPGETRRARDFVEAVANRAGITGDVSPRVLRHAFPAGEDRRRRPRACKLT